MEEAIEDLRHRVSVLEKRCAAAEYLDRMLFEEANGIEHEDEALGYVSNGSGI